MHDPSAELVENFSGPIRVARTIILDWYDGPRAGFLWLDHPSSGWHFTIFAQRPWDDEEDDNLFLLAPLPAGAEATIDEALRDQGPPPGPHWAPIWRFPSEERQLAVEATLDALIAGLGSPTVVVRSADLKSIKGAWLRSDHC